MGLTPLLDDFEALTLVAGELEVVPAGQVDLQFARDEGEGFESVEEWHEAHERFFERRSSRTR